MKNGISEEKVMKSKSAGIPSFEWEDFFASVAEDTVPAKRDRCSLSTENNPSIYEEIRWLVKGATVMKGK